jgi:hypothetical protein
MLVKVAWDNEEKTIIRYHFEKGWGWNDLYLGMQEAGKMLAEQHHTVDIIMDFKDASLIPQNALTHIQRAFKNPKPENAGLTVIIAPSRFFQALVDAAQKVMGKNANGWTLKFVMKNEAAMDAINASRAKVVEEKQQ